VENRLQWDLTNGTNCKTQTVSKLLKLDCKLDFRFTLRGGFGPGKLREGDAEASTILYSPGQGLQWSEFDGIR